MGNQQLRNILKSITFGALTAAQVNQVGSGVFADINAKVDMKNLNEITNAWRAVTNPSYGQFIPQSGFVVQETSFADTPVPIMAPSGNEVVEVTYLNIANGNFGGDAIVATLTIASADAAIDDTIQIFSASFAAGTSQIVTLNPSLQLDSTAKLMATAESSGMNVKAYTHKVAI